LHRDSLHIVMANGFEHKDLIKALREGFEKYFNEKLSRDSTVKIVWEFPNKDLESAYVSGLGNKEVKEVKTVFKVTNEKGKIEKEIPVDLIEDNKGKLTVMVNKKPACSSGQMKGISPEFLKSFAEAIKGEI